MKSKEKNKEQLMGKLVKLRKQITELKKSEININRYKKNT